MKFTLDWLKDFLDTDATIDEIVETLTAIGLEVEEVENKAKELEGFSVAEIIRADKHPNADKLQLCTVKAKDKDGNISERQIVCGAPNAREGLKVVLADIGCTIPNGEFKIKKSKIRGVESCGMLCSAAELGLGDDHSGIIELPSEAIVGTDAATALNIDDIVIDIAITPNRGDCLGVYGIARDLAAAGIGKLKTIEHQYFNSVHNESPAPRKVKIETDSCKFFTGRVITNLKNCESPEWLKKRLISVGAKPISALVDITNYISLTYGRPLHVYDNDKLRGDIIVRSAKGGEKLLALDDNDYTLPAGACAICDNSGVIGLGGIIGGTSTSTEIDTQNIFLESAWFDPISIANTGRKLHIDSDARYRFERTVDPAFVLDGLNIATKMIIDLCGTDETSVSKVVEAGAPPSLNKTVEFSPNAVSKLGGLENISDNEIAQILEKLGFSIDRSEKDRWRITAPTYRPDMEFEADIVEEVLRIKGYDKINEIELPKPTIIAEKQNDKTKKTVDDFSHAVRRFLANRGMKDSYHFAFVNDSEADIFTTKDYRKRVEILNPISSEMNIMRPNMLPAMLNSVSRNLARDNKSLAIFEYGNIFLGAKPEDQPLMVTALRTGNKYRPHWSVNAGCVDVFDIKADLYELLDYIGVDINRLKISHDTPSWYHPNKSGKISLGNKITLGYFGSIHPAVTRKFDIKQEVVAFELYVQNVPAKRSNKTSNAVKLSPYQAVKRDFAFIVDENVAAGELLTSLQAADKKLVRDITLFDVYSGKGIEQGKKSLAISVSLQSDNKTLEEEEINKVSENIIAAARKYGAELR